MEIAGHILGLIGMLIFAYSFQVSSKKKLLLINSVGVVFFIAQYGLIGAYSGLAINAIGLIRNIVFYITCIYIWEMLRLSFFCINIGK